MAKQTFTTGQVLTAAQMTSLQQTAMGGGSATTKTASYTLVAADAGTTVTMTSASATTITVNTSLFAAGDTVYIQNLGAGVSTITAGTATVNTSASLALAQYEGGQLYFVSTSAAIFLKGDGAAGTTAENYALINTGGTTLTGAGTFTVSGISKKALFLYIEDALVISGERLRITFNSDTGNNYQCSGARSAAGAAYLPFRSGDSGNIEFLRNGTSTTNGNFGFIQLRGCDGTGYKPLVLTSNCVDSTTTGNEYVQSGYYKGTSAITSVTLFTSSTNDFTGGKFYVYGAQ